MTATTPIPTGAESPLMDPTTQADPADPPPGAPPGTPPAGHVSPPTAVGRPTLRAQVAENPLASLLGAVVVALLVSMIATTNVRINRIEDKMDAGFAAQDAKFEAKFDEFEAKFDELDAKFDEMNLKLTALIAKLNATAEVDAAIEGRLIDPAGDPAEGP